MRCEARGGLAIAARNGMNSVLWTSGWWGPRARARRQSLVARVQPLLGVVAALAALELAVRAGAISRDSLPPTIDIVDALVAEAQQAAYWQAISTTLQAWAISLALATALAVPLGLMIGLNYYMFRATRPIIEFLRPVPSIALLPLAVLLYGVGRASSVFLATLGAFWQLLILTSYGARDLDPLHQETARSYRVRTVRRLAFVTLPGAVPYIATGLRIASTVALLLAIAAELLIGSPGVGRQMSAAQEGGANSLMYAYVITAGLIGLALNSIFVRLEGVALRWHPSQREARP
jgi:ABC-type nitrate/sulfonate/bicarbonate transport system permease component